MNKKILFLTLRVFSATGGIEKVCRVFAKVLSDLGGEKETGAQIFSLHDSRGDEMKKYTGNGSFRAFSSATVKFVLSSIWHSYKSDVIVLSHINLLSVGYIAKLLFPRKKLLLFVHGIEVWDHVSSSRKRMLAACDCLLSVSQFTKNKLVEQCGLRAEKITVLNNCLDPLLPPHPGCKDKDLQKRYGLQDSDIVLLTLTRMSSKELYKGYDHVLFSIEDLRDKYPAIKYLIVGRYDEVEKKRLDDIIAAHSLQQHVFFTGYVPDEELASHYALADLYVMPSKKEGFGIVFIEAMNYGLPVIAGNKDGSADALANGKLGLLVDPDSQEEIDAAIEKVLLNRPAYQPDKKLLNEYFSYDIYKEKCRQILALQ